MIKLVIPCVLLIAAGALAQAKHRDPLTDAEVDQLRDAAQEPATRLKLYVTFARARLDRLQQVRSDPKISDKEQPTHDALQDFIDVYDELNDNLDTYTDRGDDLRKALQMVIEGDTEFGSKLRAFRDSLVNSRAEAGKYDFLLGTALEAVDDGARDHRQLLAEQEETFKYKKKDKERKGDARHPE